MTTLHLMKLCVGCPTPEELEAWQQERLARGPLIHRTRHMPKRAEEIIGHGSLYWVFKGVMRARQTITALEAAIDQDGHRFCDIHLAPSLVRTEGRPFRPFQGWRYLDAESAPSDIGGGGDATAGLPEALRQELERLGLA